MWHAAIYVYVTDSICGDLNTYGPRDQQTVSNVVAESIGEWWLMEDWVRIDWGLAGDWLVDALIGFMGSIHKR